MGRLRKKAKVAQSSGVEANASAQPHMTASAKDMISTMPTEILDKIFKLLLPRKLPIVITADSGLSCQNRRIKDVYNLMSVSRQVNRSASDVLWKNVIVTVKLIHSDVASYRSGSTTLKAFGFDWTPPNRNVPARLKIAETETLENYLLNVKTVRIQLHSESLKSERSFKARSAGDKAFKEYASYFMSVLRKSRNLTKLLVEIKTDETYMSRFRFKKETKRFRWHLDTLGLFKGIGGRLEVKAVDCDGDELQIGEASLVSYIQELQTLAQELKVEKIP
ncbi:hypothetical protein BLS_009305 [Venturia inaequalis]|uniref:F-box domain-containing protein n=1 Tax=Venturia inaequalis TaxID=5025 RepID=A0A8H3YQ41_VENIN|nr:hypothetical protein BLS_009305 [Venturia inaequalis]KAE9969009.1 hypothetical protein EG328_007124 [Venturia inaequalis]KAE9972168.1 hypothetical protein EG327_009573 [Venturia inaequalis]